MAGFFPVPAQVEADFVLPWPVPLGRQPRTPLPVARPPCTADRQVRYPYPRGRYGWNTGHTAHGSTGGPNPA